MSRIGKKPILIPAAVEVKIEDRAVFAKGPKGQLSLVANEGVSLKMEEGQIIVEPKNAKEKKNRAIWGLTRALIANMVKGVVEGYEKRLEVNGVGYKANMQGKKLVLALGFSHPVEIETPEGIEITAEKNVITIKGIDKQLVGETAAKIRSKKKPEPYKGKGIKYSYEVIKRKVGKKAAGK
ncbi:MAG: 50S ribosomal protein L6 [bacterium]